MEDRSCGHGEELIDIDDQRSPSGRAGTSGRVVSAVHAVLFDIDGTLVDSTAAVERTWTLWADAHGYDAGAILRVCHGRRSQDTIADFVQDPDERAAAVTELEELELQDLRDVVALPGAPELLRVLPAHRWAAVTSGSRQLMQARLHAAGLPLPAVLVAAEDVEHGKPDPAGYLSAAAQLGGRASSCVVIEDAPAGLRAGRAAAAFTVAVCTSHPAHQLHEADVVVPDLRAITVQQQEASLSVSFA